MNKFIISLLLAVLGFGTVCAQYKLIKTKYDYTAWSYEEGDPYNPTICGILSIFPGGGQMAAHEFGRGAAFFGGAVASFLSSAIGFSVAYGGNEALGVGLMGLSLAGVAAIDIWSIVDATRVAKVKNLALRDQNSSGFNLHMKPFISTVPSYGQIRPQIGLSLKMDF